MAEKFEDLDCWNVAREMTSLVYRITHDERCLRDYGYVDQIRRASVSVMNNIAEGFDRGSHRDFVKFLYIARASAAEVRSMTYVGIDQQYLSDQDFAVLQDLCRRTSGLCWGLIKSLRKRMDLPSKLSIFLFAAVFPLMRLAQ